MMMTLNNSKTKHMLYFNIVVQDCQVITCSLIYISDMFYSTYLTITPGRSNNWASNKVFILFLWYFDFINLYFVIFCQYTLGCFRKKHFSKKIKSTTHHALAWLLVWKDQKGFLISTKFRGASGHFRFDLFYIVDFHSAHSQPSHVRAEWKSTM